MQELTLGKNALQMLPDVLLCCLEKRAVSEDVWFFPYLVALARLENWEEMKSLLRSWNLPLTAPLLRTLFLAHAAEKNGDAEGAKALLSRAGIITRNRGYLISQ